ncbi:MAG: hypothetical protein ABIS01_13025 [Ferruginibacter sp.]
MNKLLKWVGLFLFSACIFSCNPNAKDKGIPTQIANANGVKEFSKVKSLEFTFDLHKDSLHIERHWKWWPSDKKVTFYDKGDSTEFTVMDTSTADLKKLNAQFTNDQYWLLFPLHLQWDEGYTFTDNGMATGPATGKNGHKYTVQFNGKDGFTPGDMYELYLDDKFIIQEWAFHRSGVKEPTIMTSWENYEDFNGIKIARAHKSKDGNFTINFTGVSMAE